MNEIITSFIFFFAVIDPVGTIPVFIEVTKSCHPKKKKEIALKAVLVATLVLLFFLIAGEVILNAISVPLSAFQIAGGIVLFLFALSMIFGESKPEEEIGEINKESEKSIFPLAIPSIASPGAMIAAVMLTENNLYGVWDQFKVALIMLSVLLITLTFLLLAGKLFKLIGNNGASIISRVMGLILASVAVTSVLEGLKIYFKM
ncbi:MAG: MarC family transcriptional regulator [Bacteroidetes bacterium 4572_77]|nr:MAG: MarC family transcriptional regulator [Bacteroidetes bacterium 4572_77]